jgi:hypothetical protein
MRDASYEPLKGRKSNYRRLLLVLSNRLYGFFNQLNEETYDSVLIVDDRLYDRSWSKTVELLFRVWDHTATDAS